MISGIKISNLNDIGANLAPNSLFAVVDMNGTPITDKANLQIIANAILSGAGGSYFVPAAQANLALSVANAAQPNITSVGTLTSLEVTGNVQATYFIGDGGYLTNVASNGSYGNSNVAEYLPTYTGNLSADYVLANYVSGNGSALFDVAGSNVTGEVGSAAVANSVDVSNVSGIGNISLVILDGNVSNLLAGDGTWVATPSPTDIGNITFTASNISTNQANVDIAIIGNGTGNVNVQADGSTWSFQNDGTLYAPGNVVLDGPVIAVGPGANTLAADLADPVLVISNSSDAYIQAAINNVSDIGSADWAAYGHHGNDQAGWIDMGFASASFSDPNYTITGGGDGYIFVQGYLPGQAPFVGGGNLVLATGDNGLTKDIIFATGGFHVADEFARIDHANSTLHLTRTGSSITFQDATVQNTAFTTALANTLANAINWTTAPTANTDPGTAGQVAYDAGGNLFVCVDTNTWAKFAGTTSW